MSWDSLEDSVRIDQWLLSEATQGARSSFIERAQEELLHTEAWCGSIDTHGIDRLTVDGRLLSPVYPDLGVTDEDDILIAPVFTFLKACLTHQVRDGDLPLSTLIQSPQTLEQALLLTPQEWDQLGLFRDEISDSALSHLLSDSRLGSGIFVPWRFLWASQPSESEISIQLAIECRAFIERIASSGKSYPIAAKSYFLIHAKQRLLVREELCILVEHGIDLNSLPIALTSIPLIKSYCTSSRLYGREEDQMPIFNTGPNALLILCMMGPELRLAEIDDIDHPIVDEAVLQALSFKPSLLSGATTRQKRLLISSNMGL